MIYDFIWILVLEMAQRDQCPVFLAYLVTAEERMG